MTDYANIGPPVAGGDPNDPTAEDTTLYSPIKEPISEDQAVGGGSFVNSWNLRTGNVVPEDDDYNIGQMSDVDLTGLADGFALIFNSTSGNFEPQPAIGGVSSVFGRSGAVVAQEGDYNLDQMGDVVLTSPADNDILVFDLGSGEWRNEPQAAAAVTSVFGRTGAVTAQPGDYQASQVTSNPVGGIAATDVQSAIAELDTEKLGSAHEGAGGAVHPAVTISVNGFMIAADKGKLDGIEAGAQVNTVASVFGRTGAIVAAEGDYTIVQLADVNFPVAPSNGDVLTFNNATGDWEASAPAPGGVTSVFGRTGDVVAQEGDYDIAELGDVNFPVGPANDDVLTFNSTSGNWEAKAPTGGGGGEANTASNLGAGVGPFDGKVGVDLQFRSLVSQTTALAIALDAVNDEIDFTIADVIAAGASGLMTGADKTKLDGITAGAEPNTVDSVFGRTGAVVAAEGDYDLDLLGDVTITTPQIDDFLQRDATGWINKPVSAIQVVNAPAGGISATDVQAAINELDAEKTDDTTVNAHIADAIDAHDASAISNVAAGNLAATDVQAAINELDTEKVGSYIQGAEVKVNNAIGLTQTEYDALTPDANTLYLITGA